MQAKAPNEPKSARLVAEATRQQAEQRARLDADERARVSVAWARAQYARGEPAVAISHLERVAVPHPLVASALTQLRRGQLPALEDDSLAGSDGAITAADDE